MKRNTSIWIYIPSLVIVVICIALLCAWPMKWVWNYAAVAALSVAQPIDYWQAFVLMLCVSLLRGPGK